MKIETAIEIAEFCKLSNLEDALTNIEIHYLDCIPYRNTQKELLELYKDYVNIINPNLKESETYADISLSKAKEWVKNYRLKN